MEENCGESGNICDSGHGMTSLWERRIGQSGEDLSMARFSTRRDGIKSSKSRTRSWDLPVSLNLVFTRSLLYIYEICTKLLSIRHKKCVVFNYNFTSFLCQGKVIDRGNKTSKYFFPRPRISLCLHSGSGSSCHSCVLQEKHFRIFPIAICLCLQCSLVLRLVIIKRL
jgi:hypothetical protein